MKLNRDQIIKALECHAHNFSCDECPYDPYEGTGETYCGCLVAKDALSLINELTEEIEALGAEKEHLELVVEGKLKRTSALEKQVLQLTAENERLRKALCREDITIVRARANGKTEMQRNLIRIRVDAIIANTVRKMQELIFDRLDISVEGYSAEEVKSDVRDMVYQIAKEMVEEKL